MAAEAEVAQKASHLEALRAGMVRLKILRLIHGRKLQAEKSRATELELRNKQLEALLESSDLPLPGSPEADGMANRRKRHSFNESARRDGAAASAGAEDDDAGGWKKRLEKVQDEMQEEVDRLNGALEHAQQALKASEQEVRAPASHRTKPPHRATAPSHRTAAYFR